MEFSKKLMVVILVFWIISLVGASVVKIVLDKDLFNIMDYINPAFMLGLTCYFGKSGVENYQKIKGSQN